MSPSTILILAGLAFLILGVSWRLGGLPGDLSFGSGQTRLYLPIATSLVLSLVLSLAWRWLG